MSQDDPFFRLLCVEDNSTFQQMLKMALGVYGFEVVTASHGVEALMQYEVQDGRFAHIISDHEMPEMNGLAFVRSIREIGYKGRIIIMSSRLSAKELQEYEPHGITAFFHKPFDIAQLAATLLQED